MRSNVVVITITLTLYFSGCWATIYTVGDSAGWDISTDLDSWAKDKTFVVGDTLLFQYSQYHSVSEVTEENYQTCNTTNVIQSSSNGNSSFVLNISGERYYVCGNRLHCLGGMKLHAHVINNQTTSPVGAPEANGHPGGALPPGSSKSNNPSNSASFVHNGVIEALLLPFFGFYLVVFMF